jgi:hypothetical protein
MGHNSCRYTTGGHDRAMLQFKTVGIRANEEVVKKAAPAAVSRKWGPIDGGKAYGWIEEKSGGAGRPPPKAMPSVTGSFGGARATPAAAAPAAAAAAAAPSTAPAAMGRSPTMGHPMTASAAGAMGGGAGMDRSQTMASAGSASQSPSVGRRGRYAAAPEDDDIDDADIIDDEF